MNATALTTGVEQVLANWLTAEKQQQLLRSDPDFAHWLAEDYVPIAGGWQY